MMQSPILAAHAHAAQSLTVSAPPSPASRTARLSAGGLLLAQFVLIWTTFFVLSAAINWPASLDDPASVALPRLLENEGAVLFGYSCYLLAALLIVPATAAINLRLGLAGTLGSLMMALSVLSATAKAIGITRWLFAMPNLARDYVANVANQPAVTIVYNALNDYAGGIGEIVGVGLVSGIWTIMLGLLVARRATGAGAYAGWFAVLCGAGLFLTIPAGFGVELGPVLTISNIAWQFSLLFIAVWALRSPVTHR